MSAADKTQLSVVVLGHVGVGKSTVTGHLLLQTGAVDQKAMRKSEQQADKADKASLKYAWLLDTLNNERKMSCSIKISHAKLETPTHVVAVIDAPGHYEYTKNAITGIAQADAALLVVAAGDEEFENGFALTAQTREHALLAFTLGVKQLVVAVNKMDSDAVQYSEERFNSVVGDVKSYLNRLGFKTNAIVFVPVSGWTGDNLTAKADGCMPWYDGPTLLDALDALAVPKRVADKPLRVAVQTVVDLRHRGVGIVVVGRVETGVLIPGMDVTFGPTNVTAEVVSIQCHGETLAEARPGDQIGFTIKGVVPRFITRGCVVSDAKLDPAKAAIEFTAQVVILNALGTISAGYTPVFHCHTARIACCFSKITEKIDRQTGQVVELNPASVKTGDACTVVFRPQRRIVVETFQQYPQLGRFVIRDMGIVVAVGVIKSVIKSDERVAEKTPEPAAESTVTP